jgi:putative endonuclease
MAGGSVPTAKRRAYRLGHHAEWLALLWLMLKGYRLLAHRYRTKLGEIDLIVKRGGTVAFVEVKARASHDAAEDSITVAAERRIRNAADIWLARHPDAEGLTFRFDVVLIAPWRAPKHLANAF